MYYFAIEIQVEMPYPLAPAWDFNHKGQKDRSGDLVIAPGSVIEEPWSTLRQLVPICVKCMPIWDGLG